MYKLIALFTALSILLGIVMIPGNITIADEREPFTTTPMVAANEFGVFALNSNGTVDFAIDDERFAHDYAEIRDWTEIVQISVGGGASVVAGLRRDGTVVSVNAWGWGDRFYTDDWENIIEISMFGDAFSHGVLVGLRANGTVVHTGEIQAHNSQRIDSWTDIVALGAGEHPAAVKSDGTVALSWLEYPEPHWSDVIVRFFGGYVLERNGRLSATWTSASVLEEKIDDISSVVHSGVDCGAFIASVRGDGGVLLSGFFHVPHFCALYELWWCCEEGWCTGCPHPVTESYSAFYNTVTSWNNVIQIDLNVTERIGNQGCQILMAGLRSDGSVVVAGNTPNIEQLQRIVSRWNLLGDYSSILPVTIDMVEDICPDCGERKRWRITRLYDGDTLVTERRVVAKRDSQGWLIADCAGGQGGEARVLSKQKPPLRPAHSWRKSCNTFPRQVCQSLCH
jgi:hypothetical protein